MNDDTFYDLLKHCEFDPNATRHFDAFIACFIWSDEVPAPSIADEVRPMIILLPKLREIGAYRASLSLNSPRVEYEHQWNELKKNVPTWPGFREERIYGEIERRLKIYHYQVIRNLRKGGQMDHLLDDTDYISDPEK